jgi:glucosyl-3-phosphoglycerate synthase
MDQKQERITTIHDFNLDLATLENRLALVNKEYISAVLIPCLYEELKRPAIQGICAVLSTCKFINHIIVVIYAKTRDHYEESVRFFECLPQPVIILWQHSPRVLELLSGLKGQGFNPLAMEGKGKAVWLGLGIASLLADGIVLHDADILTYDRSYPLKLLFPLVETEFDIAVNKAYYSRLSPSPPRLNGRVVRLFLTPLLDCLVDIFGPCRYLLYLQSFRYPLAGELALTRDLALNVRIPNNWGLEIEFLAELYRNLSEKRIAQVDLGVFDHKHQIIGDSLDQGLQKMAADILGSLLRTLCELEQVVLTMDHIHALRVKFKRRGQDYIRQYFIDVKMNGLTYDRHQEEGVIETFEQVILEAGQRYFTQPISPQIGNWNRAIAVMPDLREQLFAAAQLDRQG